MSPHPPEVCPVCGSDVPDGARACPDCGADERSGWNEEDTLYDGLDLPEEAFEGDGDPSASVGKARRVLWWMAGLLALVAFAWMMAGFFFAMVSW